jgi:hypothetical protein
VVLPVYKVRKIWKTLKYFVWGISGVALIFFGISCQQDGFEALRKMRQMERIPEVSVSHVVPGEVSMSGQARRAKKILSSRYTKTRCFYFRYLKEVEKKDSEGDTYWSAVERGASGVSFNFVDDTGVIHVDLEKRGVRPDLEMDYRHRQGKYRYSEWRIDEGEYLFALAMATKKGGEFSLRFDLPGSYVPILSNEDALENRSGFGTDGVIKSIISVACLCFGCLLLCFALRIHRVLVFLGIGSGLTSSAMIYFGLSMMGADLLDGFGRLERLEKAASAEVEELLGSKPEWKNLPSSELGSLDPRQRNRILGIREDLVASIERTNSIRDRFPESWCAPLWGIDAWPSMLAKGETVSRESIISKTPIAEWLVLLLVGGSVVMVFWGGLSGFRRIKTKRYIENIPTSLSAGLAYGPAEIKGKVEPMVDQLIEGPLTKQDCVYYRYKITERRGSGKNAKTVVISDDEVFVPFHCRDAEGVVGIDPDGAEVTATLKKTNRMGRRTYYEWHIAPKTEVYVLGSAVVDSQKGDRLIVSDGNDDGFPFLLSDESETEVMLRQSRKGLMRIGFAQNGAVFAGITTFASYGSFAATDFLLSALVSPLFLGFTMFVLMFNDLVFLRNRVKRAWANIEVSLKKRADLIPNLEKIVKAYLSHEQSVMESVARLRSAVEGKTSYSPTEVDAAMKEETALAGRLIALRENYPDLKGDKMMDDFMNRLTRMENEVALMRAGYNDGIERYRDVKQRIPEVFIAKAFNFEVVDYLKFALEVQEVPSLDFESSREVESLPKDSVQENEAKKNVAASAKGNPQVSIYLFKDEQQSGPFTLDQVKEYVKFGSFFESDQACWDGNNWKTIAEIPGFRENSD